LRNKIINIFILNLNFILIKYIFSLQPLIVSKLIRTKYKLKQPKMEPYGA